MIKEKNFFSVILVLTFFLLLFKIDYRFVESIFCCQDDHDYFMHAETLVIDFDFDYSNQLEGFENKRFNYEGKLAPKGFLGTGLLAAPFLFIGNLISIFLSNIGVNEIMLMNSKILFYSLASPFYLFLSIFLIKKFFDDLKVNQTFFFISLLIFGSGLPYFAFERYSMTHVYEVFTIVLILYSSNKFYISTKKSNLLAFVIPVFIFLSILVKWTNFYVIYIPIFLYLLYQDKYITKNRLRNNSYFYLGIIVSFIFFIYFSYKIYGVITFNPQFVYGTSGTLTGYVGREGDILNFVSQNIKNFINILFTKEFGIFWFSPVIFCGLLLNIYLFFTDKNKLPQLISLTMYGQMFLIVLIWRSTASSYGFRYLFNLVPISLIIIFYFLSTKKNKLVLYHLSFFSIIGILSLFFFETTLLTQLSTTDETNSFGRVLRFAEPNYLEGFFKSFLDINSYLKIFTTSFLGASIFKLIFLLVDSTSFLTFLSNFGLPVQNPDFINYVNQVESVEAYKLLIVFFFLFYFARRFVLEIYR